MILPNNSMIFADDYDERLPHFKFYSGLFEFKSEPIHYKLYISIKRVTFHNETTEQLDQWASCLLNAANPPSLLQYLHQQRSNNETKGKKRLNFVLCRLYIALAIGNFKFHIIRTKKKLIWNKYSILTQKGNLKQVCYSVQKG